MKTVIVQIGNTDNKRTQKQWSEFCNDIYESIQLLADEIHFSAPSVGWADWQNATFVFAIEERFIVAMKSQIVSVRKKYIQDSVAWLEGNTEFI